MNSYDVIRDCRFIGRMRGFTIYPGQETVRFSLMQKFVSYVEPSSPHDPPYECLIDIRVQKMRFSDDVFTYYFDVSNIEDATLNKIAAFEPAYK